MKKISLLLIIASFALSCNTIKKEERVLVTGEGEEVLVINTPTARCHKCQKIIEGGLQDVIGVSQSILNLNSRTLSIVYSPEKTTSTLLNATVEKLTEKTPCR